MADASVSVAMCTCNGARWVAQQLQSILEQTLLPGEIVICDDCSADDTVQIIQRMASHSPVPIRLHLNPRNLGIAANFQQALQLCQGELIALSDQDDWWHPTKLQVLARAMAANPSATYAFCDARLVDAELMPMGYLLWDVHQFTPECEQLLASEDAMEAVSVANYATGATMLLRRQWLGHVLPVSPHWIHDGWLALMLTAFGRCIPVREALVDYRQHPGQKVGACPRAELGRLCWQRRMDRSFFERESARWADAYEHLLRNRELLRRKGDLELVRRRAMLDRDRLELRVHPERRWDLVARHWVEGDYGRYAWGAVSAAVDLAFHA
jgi:glycosyltransferase involved in cell wall biosynthesis